MLYKDKKMSIDEHALLEYGSKEGFQSEHEIKKSFEINNFSAYQNYSVNGCEPVDVFAYPKNGSSKTIFVIQSKGSSSTRVLHLFGKTEEYMNESSGSHLLSMPGQGIAYRPLELLGCEKNKGFNYYIPDITSEPIVPISTSSMPIALRYCYTGDFVARTEVGDYKKSPRQDEKNNLYKGVIQVIASLFSLHQEIERIVDNNQPSCMRIIPLIVTNTEIYVRENIEPTLLHQVKWAIYQPNPAITAASSIKIHSIFIVQKKELQEFIKRFV